MIVSLSAAVGLSVIMCAGNEARVSKSNESTLETAASTRGEPPSGMPKGDAEELPTLPSSTPLISEDDEIIPIPEMPRVAVKGGEELPEDPAAVRKEAEHALENGNVDDALSMIDVLLVLNPEDAELVEIRSDILLEKGLPEDAEVDRARCCKLGRSSCCH
jgi:hypothetical protein